MEKTLTILLLAVALAEPTVAAVSADVNDIAESYVKLVLEVGLYDPGYTDGYFGPPQWEPSDDQWAEEFPAERLRGRAETLIERLGQIDPNELGPLERQRNACLLSQLSSVRAKIDLLAGVEMPFDQESRALYGVVAPACDTEHLQSLLDQLDELLPGEGPLYARFNGLRARFTLPRSKLEAVLEAVTEECRRRTAAHVTLPADERFDIRFVTNQAWAASVTYQGDGLSLVEINSQMPFGLADIVKLVLHEIYPGHHTYLSLLDTHLYQDRGWTEYCVWPLNSPQSLLAEGLAEYGRRDLISAAEMLEFERKVLCPLAGLDPNELELYDRVMAIKDDLDVALIEAARRHLDGGMTREETGAFLARYTLTTPFGADNLVRFAEEFRSYVVTYTLGRDLIKAHVDRHSGPNATDAQRWTLFDMLLTTPQTPAGLQ